MLSSMFKQHQEQIKGRNETQEKLKKESLDSASELTTELVSLSCFACLEHYRRTLNLPRYE